MDRLVLLAGMLRDEPLEEMLRHLHHVDSIGPILDPTAYRKGMRNIDPQRKLLNALLGVQRVVREIEEEADPDGSFRRARAAARQVIDDLGVDEGGAS